MNTLMMMNTLMIINTLMMMKMMMMMMAMMVVRRGLFAGVVHDDDGCSQGFLIIFLIRMSPILPFPLTNYLFGLSRWMMMMIMI